MPQELWVTHISNGNGDSYYITTSEKAAEKIVENYVKEWWEEETRMPIPCDFNEKHIHLYFAVAENEYANIRPASVFGLSRVSRLNIGGIETEDTSPVRTIITKGD